MHKTAIPNGIFLGVAMIICSYVIYMVSPDMFFQARPGLLLAVIFIVFLKTGREAKSATNQYITFGRAFKNMFVTGAVAIFICTIFEYILINYLAPELAGIKRELELQSLETMRDMMGDGYEAVIDNAEEQIESGATTNITSIIQQYLTRLVLPVAAVAAIIALIIKRTPPQDGSGMGNGEMTEKQEQKRYVIKKDRKD